MDYFKFFDTNLLNLLPNNLDMDGSTLDEPDELPVQTEEDYESDEGYEDDDNWIF
jgi:hypothetical protein